MKLLAAIFAATLSAQTVAITMGAAGARTRLGVDVDQPIGRVLLFERGWLADGVFNARVAVGLPLSAQFAIAPGFVSVAGDRLRPALGVTWHRGEWLAFVNGLLPDIGTDQGFEWRHGKRRGIKVAGDYLTLSNGVHVASLHAGVWRSW